MNAGIVMQDNFPVDRQIRSKRIARSLDEDGSDVVIFARNTGTDPAKGELGTETRPKTEQLSYALVRRFSFLSSTPLFKIITAAVPLNPAWILWLLLVFSEHDIDVVVAGDLRTGISAAVAAKLLGIPVVLDLRENYVGLAKSIPADSLLDRIVQNEQLIGLLEQSTIKLADIVWIVVEERREELIASGVPPSKLVVVSNTPELGQQQEPNGGAESTDDEAELYNWPGFTLVYVGVLNEFRGLDLMIEAIAALREQGNDSVHLAIAGDGPHKESLERRSRKLGVTEQVTFLGWIDSEQVSAFLASGDVGVIPHRVTPLTEQTVPNKLFDCMMVGLPVLARDMAPIRRIIESERCGWVLPRGVAPAETAAKISEIQTMDIEHIGENGRKAVEQRYNWEHEAKQVTESLRALTTSDK